jgi:hypothetical protein
MRRMQTTTRTIALAGLALTGAASTATAAPTAGSAALRHYEGTVVSVNRDTRTFRLRDGERGTVRIKVTASSARAAAATTVAMVTTTDA